jgi:hypothetical protein
LFRRCRPSLVFLFFYFHSLQVFSFFIICYSILIEVF